MRPLFSHARSWTLVALLLALLMAPSALFLLMPAKGSKITKANYDRIQEGMTITEVENLFGCPEGIYCTGTFVNLSCGIGVVGQHTRMWVTDETACEVTFNRDGKVVRKFSYEPMMLNEPGWFEKAKGFIRQVTGL